MFFDNFGLMNLFRRLTIPGIDEIYGDRHTDTRSFLDFVCGRKLQFK
jgi:hypothetical protein